MAEILDISQLLANEYEPKRVFRWIIAFDGIDAFTAKTAQRPKKNTEETKIDFINQKRFLAGKTEWQTLDITFYDPISPSASQKLTQWLRLVHDQETGRMGYATFYYKNVDLKLLDGLGNVVEKWNLIGVWPKDIDFGTLDYSSSDAVEISCTFRFNNAVLEF